MCLKKNREFLFLFEGIMTNPNGDPDQENRPRMDYETSTLLVSDMRRKRDIRDFLKSKGYRIFVDTLAEKKVPMDVMFEAVVKEFLSSEDDVMELLKDENIKENWPLEEDLAKCYEKYCGLKKDKKSKKIISDFNNFISEEIIKRKLIDIRLFGSAMAVENHSKTYTGPVQIAWGYSLHPCKTIKSNTITSIMNDDNSTFGKKHQVEYALIAHYGTVNKFASRHTGMKEDDLEIFKKALIQGMMNNQTSSKNGQNPLMYMEIEYSENFDGYIGDLRRFIEVNNDERTKSIKDIKLDFSELSNVIKDLHNKKYVESVNIWKHPYAIKDSITGLSGIEKLIRDIDLWKAIE